MTRRAARAVLLAILAAAAGTVARQGGVGASAEEGDGAAPAGSDAEELAWRARRPHVSLLLLGGQRGMLLPAGGTEPRLGGVERVAALADRLRARAGPGGFATLSLGGSMAGRGEPQEESKATVYRAFLAELGARALLLGTSDLYVQGMVQPFDRGTDAPPDASGGIDLPRPPLNVRLRETSPAALTPPFADFPVRDVSLRALGLVDPEGVERLQADGIAADVVAAGPAVQSLQPKPDALWVFAAALPGTQLEQLTSGARRLGPSVVVDLAGGTGARAVAPRRLGDEPLVVSFAGLGREVGVLDVDPAPAGEGPGWVVSFRALPLPPAVDRWRSPLRDEVVRPLLERYRAEVRERGYLRDFPATFADEGSTRYLGSAACAGCHPGIYEEWLSTRHALALDTLADADQHHDPECVRCHVVGWERLADGRFTRTTSGFADPARTAHLGGVGCENCHGPGSVHVASPRDRTVWEPGPGRRNVRRPSLAECLGCHDADNDADFPARWAAGALPPVDHRRVPSDRRTVERPPGR